MSLTNYYSMMGLQTEEPYGAHFIPGGLQGSTAGCAKPARGAEEEEGTPGSHIPDFSHFSNKQTSLNGFSPWTNTSTSSSSSSPQLQSAPGAPIPSLFHPHHLLSHHHHHPYYGPQAQTHTEHVASASESRFVRCWEGATTTSDTALSQVSANFPACLPVQGDLSNPSLRYETIKPESSPPTHDSPDDSSFASPAEVVLERLGTVDEPSRKPEPKKEDEERTTQQQQQQQQQHDPGKDTLNSRVFISFKKWQYTGV